VHVDVHLHVAIPPGCIIKSEKIKSGTVSCEIRIGTGTGTGIRNHVVFRGTDGRQPTGKVIHPLIARRVPEQCACVPNKHRLPIVGSNE
jgi:hypothetical protein